MVSRVKHELPPMQDVDWIMTNSSRLIYSKGKELNLLTAQVEIYPMETPLKEIWISEDSHVCSSYLKLRSSGKTVLDSGTVGQQDGLHCERMRNEY